MRRAVPFVIDPDRATRAGSAHHVLVLLVLAALVSALLPGTAGADPSEGPAQSPAGDRTATLPADRQQPFACTVQDHGLGQPTVDNDDGLGVPVYAEDPDGSFDPATSEVVGYSQDCLAETRHWYYAFGVDGRGYVVRGPGDDEPISTDDLDELLAEAGTSLATTEVIDVDGVEQVPYVVRHERGVINRFIYSISVLVELDEVLTGDPASTDGTVWNGRLLYQFQGGVGIGHSQGRYDDGAARGVEPGPTNDRARAIKGEPDRLGAGYAVIYSTATRTGDHYNLLVGGQTATQVKDHFVVRYGQPRYTVGVGGSGGGIQQYVYNQNHPDLLDAAIPQRSYPDMSTQTIHVGDCALIDRYLDLDAADDEFWADYGRRQWLQGLNAIEGYLGSTGSALAQAQTLLTANGVIPGGPQTGSSECLEGWFGLAPLAMNPTFGSESNWDLLGEQVDDIERTHFNDVREAYGTDPDTGFARVPWDNVGVQYGLQALVRGELDPTRFLDVNARIGGWAQSEQMVGEAAPFLGADGGSFNAASDLFAIIGGNLDWDPWSARNMRLSPDGGVTPAPRREGDLEAITGAYTSGLVFLGAPEREIPIIEARDHLEHVLDMHNAHQSFAVRDRLLAGQGHTENLVIWWLATDEDGRSPALLDFYNEAFAVIAEWIGAMEDDPSLSVGEARPTLATDRCLDVDGSELAAGEGVWDGAFDPEPTGDCAAAFEINTTSRIEAGGPVTGDVYKCHTMPVDTAIAEGLYGDWAPSDAERDRLAAVFPDGVCDYTLPGVADPRAQVPGAVDLEVDEGDGAGESDGSGAVLKVSGAAPGAEVQLRLGGEVVATAQADAEATAGFAVVSDGAYVAAQVVDGQRGLLSAPVVVGEVPGQPEVPEVPATPSFPDVGPDNVHLAAIERLAAAGVLRGYPDGSFRPGAWSTRGQIASVVARAGQLEPVDDGPFTDVEGGVHAGAINALAEAGIVTGREDGSFGPGETVTRAQLASILARYGELDDGPVDVFADVPAGSPHAAAIGALSELGVILGYDEVSFGYPDPVTRQQTASLIVRLFDVLGRQLPELEADQDAPGTLAGTLSAEEAAEVGAAVAEFGFALHRELAEAGENTVTSPLSASVLLAMVAAGAKGQTAEQFIEVLGIDDVRDVRYAALLADLQAAGEVTVSVANGLWVNDGMGLVDDYVGHVRRVFDAEIAEADLGSPATADAIDDWVSDGTEGLIEQIAEDLGLPDPAMALVLVNTVYFLGEWSEAFDPDATFDALFTLADGQIVEVPTMARFDGGVTTAQGDGFRLARLPYGESGRFVFEVLLPDRGLGLDALLDGLDAEAWATAADALQPGGAGGILLPSFELSWDSSLVEALQALGLQAAFGPGADFRGLSPVNPPLGQVVQKTYVRVDEEGTEAAAATGGAMPTAEPLEPPVVVDRPFAFTISDTQTGTVLFLGSVHDPRD